MIPELPTTPVAAQKRGADDFARSSRDDRLYEDPTEFGRRYRLGWQSARRSAPEQEPWGAPAGTSGLLAEYGVVPNGILPTAVPEPTPPAEVPPASTSAPESLKTAAEVPSRTPPPVPSRSGRPEYRVPLMTEIATIPKNGFRAISFFSGCGGSSLGYKMAGFEVLWANEFIPAAQETYRANHHGTILDGRDIRQVTADEVLRAIGLKRGELDLLDGSPPCASFSTAGKREELWGKVKKYSDTKQRTDDLFFEFTRLLEGIQPKVFVAENVPGLTIGVAKDEMLGDGQLDAFETQDDTILHSLMNCGYRVGYHVVNAADCGVPQARRRVIFVGIRKDLATRFNLEPVWPRPLGYVYTVRDACPWIVKVQQTNAFGGDRVNNGDAPLPTLTTVGLGAKVATHVDVEAETDISRFAIGREWDNLKPGEQSEKYFSLIKVHPDLPCPTVCASHGSGGIASITHPTEKRKFSIGELKRLCGFPDDFVLTGTYEQRWERLGRAVPPLMMAAVAATVRDELLAKIRAGTPVEVPPPAPVVPVPEPEPLVQPPAPVAVGQLELFA